VPDKGIVAMEHPLQRQLGPLRGSSSP